MGLSTEPRAGSPEVRSYVNSLDLPLFESLLFDRYDYLTTKDLFSSECSNPSEDAFSCYRDRVMKKVEFLESVCLNIRTSKADSAASDGHAVPGGHWNVFQDW
jgi:hypothetical protein